VIYLNFDHHYPAWRTSQESVAVLFSYRFGDQNGQPGKCEKFFKYNLRWLPGSLLKDER